MWGTNGRKAVDYAAAKGRRSLAGIYHVAGVNTRELHHAAEKPVELLRALVQIAPEGGTVLDCFMGSGSTGVACVKEGRSFVGMELDAGYYAAAAARIRAAGGEPEEA